MAACFAVFIFALMIPVAIFVFWLVYRQAKETQAEDAHRRMLERVTLQPDYNGNYPARITSAGVIYIPPGNFVQPVPTNLNYSYSYNGGTATRGETIAAVAQPTELPSGPLLPTAPTLSNLLETGWLPTRQRMLLGYGVNGPVYGGIADLLSVGIAGRPGQGKSTLLRFVYWQVIRAGGKALVLDPHGSILEDVATAPVEFEASTGEELTIAAAWMVQELESRLDQRKKGQRDFIPMLALCDELPVISLSSKAAGEAIGRVVLEGRKVSMFCLISGQGLPASQFGGQLVRDALSSRYIFKTSPAEARRSGLDKEAARLVDLLEPGLAILAGIVEPEVVAIPNTTGVDLEHLTESTRSSDVYEGVIIPTRRSETQPENNARGQSIEDRAVRAWKEGANSIRKLGEHLELTYYQANQLYHQLKAKGLID